jgi:hypothetical protein
VDAAPIVSALPRLCPAMKFVPVAPATAKPTVVVN